MPKRNKLDVSISTHAWIRGGERLRKEFELSEEVLDYVWLIEKAKDAIRYGRLINIEGDIHIYRLDDFDFLLASKDEKPNKYVLVTVINKNT